jgi:CRISPR-associated protein Cmr1
MTAMQANPYKLKALTDIWTGDRTGNPSRLITTGLLGSIRWWCEVIVRGLGGSACDPSNTQARCPDRQRGRCVVCELFGCTSWSHSTRSRPS